MMLCLCLREVYWKVSLRWVQKEVDIPETKDLANHGHGLPDITEYLICEQHKRMSGSLEEYSEINYSLGEIERDDRRKTYRAI